VIHGRRGGKSTFEAGFRVEEEVGGGGNLLAFFEA
jgi:hypothetical protein